MKIFRPFVAFTLVCFALSPSAQALVPAPDGAYPNFTTAEGQNALFSLTTGLANTAVGWFSLRSLTNGSGNTGVGAGTLLLNTGDENTAVGAVALLNNSEGSENTATGFQALFSNTTGDGNTANGDQALYSNTTGYINVAAGFIALYSNTTGHRNTAVGQQALYSNTEGYRNTATGMSALFFNTTGNFNTGFGWTSLDNNQTGSFNTALGAGAGYFLEGDNNIAVGSGGDPADSNTIRIGTVVEYIDPDPPNEVHPAHTATYIAGISGQTASGGVAVYINSDGKLGTLTSSARFKDEIKPMDQTSEAVLALKPVTFRYKHEIDPKGIPQFGLVAEEVAKVNPDLVARDAKGEIYTVRYEAVNAMLLNEFLKEHKKVQDLETTIAQQQKGMEILTAQLTEQAAQIQKVSAQLEVNKPTPRVVKNKS